MPIGLATKPIEDRHPDLCSPSGFVFSAYEAVWLKRILKDLGIPIKDPTSLYCDNMSNIYLARNPVFHTRTKHIEVHYRFIRERVVEVILADA